MTYILETENCTLAVIVNPQAPVAQKIADEVVFDVSEVKESSFLKIGLH